MSSKRPTQRTWFKRIGYQAVRISLWFAFKILFGLRYQGREHFPRDSAALVCSNHQSHLDPMLIGCIPTRRMNFLAKKELFRGPLGWLVSFLDSIPIDRDGIAAVSGMKETLKRLRDGEMVLMFPEGTRSSDGELQPILPGFVALVRRVKAPIIPVGVDGAYRAWPRGAKIFRPFRRIRVSVGQPIDNSEFEGIDDAAVVERLQSAIRQCVDAAKRL